ncbi:MAG: adenine deaminase C-terminal domain-containing protein [Trueperaceae bacterium]
MHERSGPDPAGRPTLSEIRHAVAVAAGRVTADQRLAGGRVLDPFTGTLRDADVDLAGRLIAAVFDRDGPGREDRPEPVHEDDLSGRVVTPGLIDGHMHLESSLVAPASYAEAVLPRGVTAVVCDPHEVANVAGEAGVRWLLDRADGLPFDVFVTVPSCVPSTDLETSGAVLDAAAVARLMEHPTAVGLAELMSFPQAIAGAEGPLAKALATEAHGGTVEGHAPGLSGAALQAYAAIGVGSEHEASTLKEATEKLRAGLFIWIREGSVARDARALAPLVRTAHRGRVGFCTDDVLPHDLRTYGGVDGAVRIAVQAGSDAIEAMIGATWSAARHYRLPRRGAVAPGMLADLVVWRARTNDAVAGIDADLFAERVFKEGRLVAADGRMRTHVRPPDRSDVDDRPLLGTVHLPGDLEARVHTALQLRSDADPSEPAPAIGVRPGDLRTDAVSHVPRALDGRLAAAPGRDLAILLCAERHGRGGRVAATQAHGCGLRRGAIAISVGHDHHNLMAIGADASALIVACRRVAALDGGIVVVGDEGRIVAETALPLGGLLTDAALETVADDLARLDGAAVDLGCTVPAPAMALSFLGLAVIPERKLTDRGLVDVAAGRIVPQPWGAA